MIEQPINDQIHESLPCLDWLPDNHYGNRYRKFINHFRNLRQDHSKRKVGYHRHHIIPRHYGEDNSELNLVRLTPREHALAHLLLAKATNNYKDWWAVCRTLRDATSNKLRTTKFLEKYKKNPKASKETREKQSQSRKKLVENGWKPHNYGTAGMKLPKASEAAKRAWETRRKNGNDKMSEEQKDKIATSVRRTKRKSKQDDIVETTVKAVEIEDKEPLW